MQTTVPFDRIPGSKQLFLDYLSGVASEFYSYPFISQESFTSVQQKLSRRSFERERTVAALLRQNHQFGAGPKTIENINKLLDPTTTAVFTGQQVTIFGGPLYVFYKAALAVRLAESNCRRLQSPVVPIFWLAADDADFDEVAKVIVPGKDENLLELVYQPKQHPDGQAMGSVRFDDAILALLDQYELALPDTEFRGELMAQLRKCYQPGESIVTAFGKYLSYLFKDTGLIFVDPSDDEFRRLALPVFQRELKLREEVARAIEKGNAALEAKGYHLQVTKAGEFSNLFFCDGKRTRIDFAAGGFTVDGKYVDQSALEVKVADAPSLFAPNVFLRPIVQSHIFPTLIYFAGPAEAAYFSQMRELFDLFDEVPPVIYPRFSATIIERNVARIMEKYRRTFEDFLGDVGKQITEVMKRTYPADFDSMFADLRDNVRQRLGEIAQMIDPSDHGLVTNAARIAGRIDVEIKSLEEKVFQAHRKKNQTVRAQLERVAFHLHPT
ncbi:MAG: bacillithiol biosynthesis cysteine-adding enzyme BshC, partial [candidate division Zixibacteria bacterium]|nr:bacillithiol biosynthesis cysteine-adding enzyme BshC [candidate division Zixibacteria bacterium]